MKAIGEHTTWYHTHYGIIYSRVTCHKMNLLFPGGAGLFFA